MLNSDFNVDVLSPDPEREHYRADIGGGANAPRFHTSHDVHDFGSYPMGTENDGVGNRAEVQQEVAEDGYATDHEGVEHEPSNLAVNENIVAEVCFCLSVVAPPRHESPEYFTRGRRSCPADGLGVRVQFLLTYEIESESRV
uniref:Uncharacterized protein n=1 Tax=Ananas comosus var. bracteatus TaxID=296719 RepID=A0A6V7QMQ6_ANACO|nr:unnamed protein product [Ananas comosus var. bracteatus]